MLQPKQPNIIPPILKNKVILSKVIKLLPAENCERAGERHTSKDGTLNTTFCQK